MTKLLTLLLLAISSAHTSAQSAENEVLLKEIINSAYSYAEYGYDNSFLTMERLTRLEADIEKLKNLAVLYPNEPRLYYVISDLYRKRDYLLKRMIHYKNREQWFALPVARENLQGGRDNCTEAIRLQELGLGAPLTANMIDACSGPTQSRQFLERAIKVKHKMLPDVIECNHDKDPDGDCITHYKKDIVLMDYLDVQNEYISYGYFDDAERLNREISQVSEEGKEESEKRTIKIENARARFNPEVYKDDVDYSLMQPGGIPKPITIKAVDAIAQFKEATTEKKTTTETIVQSSVSASEGVAASKPSELPAVSHSEVGKDQNSKLVWIGFITITILLGIVILLRRKK